MPSSDSPARKPALCVVGVGPRASSLIERISALVHESDPLPAWELHLVDDAPFGAGRIWRTDQIHELCMNTLADAVTLFTDEVTTVHGPIIVGPSLYEWCLLAAECIRPGSRPDAATVPAAHRPAFGDAALRPEFIASEALVAEITRVRPESHPSRALYGSYSTWCLDRALGLLGENVTVVPHPTRAVAIEQSPAASGEVALERVLLADGTAVDADAVVLSLGFIPSAISPAETALENAVAGTELIWVRSGSPVEQPLERIPDSEPTIVRGLGMGFFDSMALLSLGRGGAFVGEIDDMHYQPSGREPLLHVTSGRGVPYRAKTRYGALPPRAVQTHFSAFDPSALDRPIDFHADLWPLIVQDTHAGWYRTLSEIRPEAFRGTLDAVLARIADRELAMNAQALDAALAALVPDPADRLDLDAVIYPVSGTFASPDAFHDALVHFVRTDLHESGQGLRSPLKNALWEMNAARQPVSKLLSFDQGVAEAHESPEYRGFAALGGMIGSGPPAFRSAQLLALAEAGIVRFIGPAGSIAVEPAAGFVSESPVVAGSTVRARVLLDAFYHMHDTRRSIDPIVVSLRERGVLRPHSRPTISGDRRPGSGIDIEPTTSRLVHVDGAIDTRLHAIGIPVNDTRGDTVISPMPRTNATFLRESDGAALSALRQLFPTRVAERTSLHV